MTIQARFCGEDFGLATIVVPAHNVEDYISDCLHSILAQTYPNIEVLIVDDGSTDNTVGVIQSFLEHDSRIQLFCNSNHGVSFSRNYAIERGVGKYLLFVDADDIIAPDFIETLVLPLSDGECKCSVAGIGSFGGNNPKFHSGKQTFYRNNEVIKSIFNDCGGFLCNKGFLYKIVQQHGIRLQENIAQSEDMLFLLDYLFYCDCLFYDSGVRYGYRKRAGSATMDLGNFRWFDIVKVFNNCLDRYAENHEIAFVISKNFLPIAYEGLFRYRLNKLSDASLLSALSEMQRECETCLRKSSPAFRFKMFLFRHFTFAVIMKRIRGVTA